ncbi:MAG: hypothetical protein R6T98_13435, partial [Desulfatiglandales bacterium]
ILAQRWQSHIPLLMSQRWSCVMPGSYLGPPGAAARMCAATPVFVALVGSELGPYARLPQRGFEQRVPTRWARVRFVTVEKSSRLFIFCSFIQHWAYR